MPDSRAFVSASRRRLLIALAAATLSAGLRAFARALLAASPALGIDPAVRIYIIASCISVFNDIGRSRVAYGCFDPSP